MKDKELSTFEIIFKPILLLILFILMTVVISGPIYKKIVSPTTERKNYYAKDEFVREVLGNKRLFDKGNLKAMSTTPVKNIYDGEYFVSDVSKNGFTLNYTGIPNEDACQRIIFMHEERFILNYRTLNNINYNEALYSSEGRNSVCKQTDGKPINITMVF